MVTTPIALNATTVTLNSTPAVSRRCRASSTETPAGSSAGAGATALCATPTPYADARASDTCPRRRLPRALWGTHRPGHGHRTAHHVGCAARERPRAHARAAGQRDRRRAGATL